ncbi:DUF4345 family protein [Gammaproteobacteria bacterium]|jgi:hypothetical protein|nr:DUF4345 family protein [Gammaproteobacteria bacterium]MDC1147972.1 DUF4345 family protein [Gammaproteobacteria bacterium]|tara:strand:+ start:121 stop:507 length:387 start_codon:yes stop_codon:yes gene_type:complete
MLKVSIIFSAVCLFTIGCYVMFKPDLTDLGIIPVVATNPETASEFRSLFAGSFIAYAYLLLRFTFSYNPISIAVSIAYIMGFIAFGRIVSFFYEGINSFGLIVFFGEIFLALVLIMAHKKRKNEIPYF